MPTPTRGKVHWYDFGPIVGSELSDERPALIISNSALNHTTTVAIAAPLSTTPPSTRHLRNHVFIEDAASWASVRQIKTVSQQELGDEIATATPAELASALEILAGRFFRSPGSEEILQTDYGEETITRGAVWETEFRQIDGQTNSHQLLVLDYNAANQMAIAADLDFRDREESTISKPVILMETGVPATVRIHRVLSVDMSRRAVRRTGTITGDDLHMVYSKLARLLSAD